ncbi:hypothetical protein E3W21_24970 [Pseudomonas sp. F01002]|nr:hypothetical protein E3W21_24970 [Pseudomonas sp. F01002]
MDERHAGPCDVYAEYRNPCGSGLAREGGVSVNITIECHALFASKLAPTLDLYKPIKKCPVSIDTGHFHVCSRPACGGP